MRSLFPLSLLFLLLLASGCTHRNDAPGGKAASSAPAGSLSAMLCDREWRMVMATAEPGIDLDGDGAAHTELIATEEMGRCVLENAEVYRFDGTYTGLGGSQQCEEKQGRWRFSADSMNLLLTLPGGTEQNIRVLELSDTRLQTSVGLRRGGRLYTLTTTYAHGNQGR